MEFEMPSHLHTKLATLTHQTLCERWKCFQHLPSETHVALVQVRSAAAKSASVGDREDRAPAKRCSSLLDRLQRCRHYRNRGDAPHSHGWDKVRTSVGQLLVRAGGRSSEPEVSKRALPWKMCVARKVQSRRTIGRVLCECHRMTQRLSESPKRRRM